MKIRAVWSIGWMVALSPWVFADTLTLKSGEKVEGRITAETAQEVTVEIQVSASIKDSRTIAKADIASTQRRSADDLAWEELRGIATGDNSHPLDWYELAGKRLQGFLTAFPQSPHAAEAQKTLAAVTAEKARIQGGEVRVFGRWLTQAEVQAERYQLLGQSLYGQMQDAAKRGDYTGAMNIYDELEKTHPGARVLPDAITYATRLLPALKSLAERNLENWKVNKAERARGVALASGAHKAELLAAQQQEEKAADAAVDAAQKGTAHWPALQIAGEKSGQAVLARVQSETTRLAALPVAKMRQSFAQADAGVLAMGQHDRAAAQTAFQGAVQLWPANEIALRHQKELSNAKAATPAPAQTVAATPPPATPMPKTVVRATPPPTAAAPTIVAQKEESGPNYLIYGLVAAAVLGIIYFVIKRRKKGQDDEIVG